VPKIQDVFRLWGAEHWRGKLQNLQHVSVDAEVRSGPAERASGVACLFSGGGTPSIRCSSTARRSPHIIVVHGFDIGLEDRELRVQASRMAREVARELGKSLIEVETNLRSFSDALVGWEKYHGAAMASVALLFQHRFRKVLIASSHTYSRMQQWGSHMLLDPLWSTELTEIEHDGSAARRVDKAAYISEYELPMEWLRVCFENPGSAYNCGRCGKCLVPRVTLRAVGALERRKTLPSEWDLEEVADMDLMNNESRRGVVRQLLKVLERLGTEGAERQRLQQLSLAQKKLERTAPG
jgi:hypothetical protein